MTKEEYIKTLCELDDLIRLPKSQFEEYVNATYERMAMLIKPSLYYRLFRRPWNFLCKPFNRLLNWIGDKLPLRDIDGEPMDDRYIHFTVMLKMAGFVPRTDYGWHVVDMQPVCYMEPETFKKYFRSQAQATQGLTKDQAVDFLDLLYSDYVEKHHIFDTGRYHRFDQKTRNKILNVIGKADPAKSYIQLGEPGSIQKLRANFNIDKKHYMYLEVNTVSNMPQGAPKTIVRVSWTKQNDDNDVVKHQIWYDGDRLGWLMRHVEELAPLYQKVLEGQMEKLIDSVEKFTVETKSLLWRKCKFIFT